MDFVSDTKRHLYGVSPPRVVPAWSNALSRPTPIMKVAGHGTFFVPWVFSLPRRGNP